MKKSLINSVKTAFGLVALAFMVNAQSALAQAPNRMSYQAVIRTASNALVINQNVGMQVSILQGSSNGTPVYVETHSATTNANGLVSIQIGGGTVVSGVFANITWGNGTFFLKAETDPNGGSNYTITATSQLISVPYALHAGNGLPAGGTEGQSITMCDGVPTWTTGGVCPPTYPTNTVHCNTSNPTQIIEVLNPSTGRIWMDRNLGATQVAVSANDLAAIGSYYQWGRASDGHQCPNSPTTTVSSTTATPGHGSFIINPSAIWTSNSFTNLWQGVNGVNNPCPSGFRVPTQAEWQTERLSWSSNNYLGAIGSPLKLPSTSFRNGLNGEALPNNTTPQNYNYNSVYWSSTLGITASASGTLNFDLTSAVTNNQSNRGNGHSVRCIKN